MPSSTLLCCFASPLFPLFPVSLLCKKGEKNKGKGVLIYIIWNNSVFIYRMSLSISKAFPLS